MNNYFIAVIPEDKIKEKIFLEVEKIKRHLKKENIDLKNFSFVNKDLFHITLKFLGKNESYALNYFKTFNIRFQKFSAFKYNYFLFKESSFIRVFFINYLACNGNYHLTLFRIKKPFLKEPFLNSFIEENHLNSDFSFFEDISFFANKIYLLKSVFEKGVLKYVVVDEKETLNSF